MMVTDFDIEDDCKRVGLWREDANNKWDQFLIDLDLSIGDNELSGLDWSEELSASASNIVERLSGCNVWAHNVMENLYETSYLESLAVFADHRRFIIYPERFQWADAKETVWDLLMDDDSWQGQNLAALFSNDMTHIGVACNCHPTFEQFCVIEIGQDVESIDDEHTHIYYDGIDVNHTHPSELNTTGLVISEFHMAGAFGCPVSRRDGLCNAIDFNDDTPVI